MIVTETILNKVIGDNDGARNLCLLLMLGGYENDIEELCFYRIREKRAENLYNICNGDLELIHLSIQFISRENVSLNAIHKRLDMDEPMPLINRKIRNDESYSEFFDEQLNECWPIVENDNKKVRKIK